MAVVNVRSFRRRRSTNDAPYPFIYVGRNNNLWRLGTHPLANPFRLKPGATEADRLRCLAEYAAWLARHPLFAGELRLLAKKVKRTGRPLACWCAPKRCHADLLSAMVNRMLEAPTGEPQ